MKCSTLPRHTNPVHLQLGAPPNPPRTQDFTTLAGNDRGRQHVRKPVPDGRPKRLLASRHTTSRGVMIRAQLTPIPQRNHTVEPLEVSPFRQCPSLCARVRLQSTPGALQQRDTRRCCTPSPPYAAATASHTTRRHKGPSRAPHPTPQPHRLEQSPLSRLHLPLPHPNPPPPMSQTGDATHAPLKRRHQPGNDLRPFRRLPSATLTAYACLPARRRPVLRVLNPRPGPHPNLPPPAS